MCMSCGSHVPSPDEGQAGSTSAPQCGADGPQYGHAVPQAPAASGQSLDVVQAEPPVVSDSALSASSEDGGKKQQQVESAHLWLRRGDQLFVGILVVTAVALMVAQWARLSRWGTEPVEIERLESSWYEFQIDINSATWVEWAQLPGIGQTLAQRIVADRETNGSFQSVDDLQRVKGIGPKTVEKLRPWLEIP